MANRLITPSKAKGMESQAKKMKSAEQSDGYATIGPITAHVINDPRLVVCRICVDGEPPHRDI